MAEWWCLRKGFGWIEDGNTGEKIWMHEKGGMCVVRLWVNRGRAGF